jgi:hemoglobin
MPVVPNPLAMWNKLPSDRRGHVRWAMGGVTMSWALAALMACTTIDGKTALYQQLGGEKNIAAVTDRTLERMVANPHTKRSFDGVKLAALKQSVSAYICKIADGPCVYEGETMVKSHAQSHITGAEFDIMVAVLREELGRAGVSEAAKNELLRRLAPTRRDIVKS